MKNQLKTRVFSFFVIMSVLLSAVGMPLIHTRAATTVYVDGAASSGTSAPTNSSISFSHTTGTGTNRLLLVGVSWNCGTTDRSISTITFTPSGGSALALTEVIKQLGYSSSNPRYSAIYRLLAPPSGVTGTIDIVFSGAVSNGIIAGAANFAGVDQSTPLGTAIGAAGGGTSSPSNSPSITLTGLTGDEMVFDNVFIGASSTSHSITADSAQTPQWNVVGYTSSSSFNAIGAASTKPAPGTSATMSWTAVGFGTTQTRWAVAAVPIRPAPIGPTYNLTVAVSPSGGGTTNPPVGVNAIAQGSTVTVTATANSGYAFSDWSGACTGSGACSVLMDGDKSVTANFAAAINFTGTELLGRPETDRISVSMVPASAATFRAQYSTSSNTGPWTTASGTVAATAGQPVVYTITGLSANTKYWYHMQYSTDGGSTWTSRDAHTFYTARAVGSTFTFDITSDSHINIQLGNTSNWNSTLTKVAADVPDFLIDLGDTAAMDNTSSSVPLGDTAAAEQKYKDLLPYFNLVSGSSPIFLLPGNHEQQENWHYQVVTDKATSLPIMSKNAEKKYFLNPDGSDSFYSGDTTTYPTLSGSGYKDDYYAWTWGDALFVVIDPFWYTTTKPYTTLTGGGETDATGSDNRWDWTLGQAQFNWLKSTLQGSSAKYKFIFSHQIVGGDSASSMVNYGHGGVNSADLVEWGGFDVGTTNNTWATNRPVGTWGSQPIRQMMEASGVTAFFHGHDHQMAYEKYNSIVYQSVPSGSFTGSFGIYTTGGNSGKTIWADSTQGPGYLRVTVGPSQTTVEFIRYNSTTIPETYTMAPNSTTTNTLTVNKPGTGTGTVTSSPAGIDCGATCSANFSSGTSVILTAAAATGSTFTGWSGEGCSGTGTCTVSMTAARTVTATFTINTYGLTVSRTGTGSGTVTSAPAGIDCGATCSANFNFNTSVTLTASASAGSTFTGWSGEGCSGTGTCTVSMTAARSVTATFTANPSTFALTVTKPGTGTGTVTSSPAGIDCGSTCSANFSSGTSVTLTAAASAGSTFTGWSGEGCSGTSTCTVSMTAARSVTATFTINTYGLTVNRTGTGTGTVTSSPSGINCGATCSASFNYNTSVILTASAAAGSTFTGWSGEGCSGTGTCTVSMTAARTVTATFTINTYGLTVNRTGTGSGMVTSAPAGIDCGATCSANFNFNTSVTLTASASAGSTFTGWSGEGCSGTGTCVVSMTAVRTVTATFTVNNVAPVASNDNYTTQKNLAMTIDAPGVLGNDTDANGDALTARNGSVASSGTVTLNTNGSFSYTPATDFTGEATFTYQAYDGALYSTVATVTIHITDDTPPVVPSSFHGQINISPNPPSAGDFVDAYVPGAASYVARTTIKNTSPLTYAIDVPGDVVGTSAKEGGVDGDLVTFKINGNVVGTGTWHSGTSVLLDFTSISYSVSLVSGWNLISFNLHPAITTTATVLSSIDTKYDLVYAWNAATGTWMKYVPGAGYGNTLEDLDESMGFWIRMTSTSILTVSGSAPSSSIIPLEAGWNLVGFPASANHALPEAFGDHGVGTDFSLVYAYHANDTSDPYDPWKKFDRTAGFGNDLTTLSPGWGYWVKVGGIHNWDVTY